LYSLLKSGTGDKGDGMEQKNPEKEQIEESDGPTQVLKMEHQATLLKLELIERSLQYLRRPPKETLPERVEIEKILLRDLAAAIENEIGPHFRKEEEALFPVLAEYIGKEYGPIEMMVREHEKIRLAFFSWRKALPSFCRSIEPIDEAIRKAVIDPGLRLIHILRQHINKENQILFRISESTLTPDEKKAVLQKMKAASKK
jgi:hemerythrin-like domain-containing protein